jgi:hypothetical protein
MLLFYFGNAIRLGMGMLHALRSDIHVASQCNPGYYSGSGGICTACPPGKILTNASGGTLAASCSNVRVVFLNAHASVWGSNQNMAVSECGVCV